MEYIIRRNDEKKIHYTHFAHCLCIINGITSTWFAWHAFCWRNVTHTQKTASEMCIDDFSSVIVQQIDSQIHFQLTHSESHRFSLLLNSREVENNENHSMECSKSIEWKNLLATFLAWNCQRANAIFIRYDLLFSKIDTSTNKNVN